MDTLKNLLLEIEKFKAKNKLPETGSVKDAPVPVGLLALILGGAFYRAAERKKCIQ